MGRYTRNTKYSTILAGVMGLSTLVMFHQGAEALDLSDFSGADQKVITQDAPKAGGIVLVKEKMVYPSQPTKMQATVAQPMMRGTKFSAPVMTNASAYNNITPAAGGSMATSNGISSKTDITLQPGNAFDQAQAKFKGAAPSAPVDGKPLTTTTLANGARVNDIAEIAPAAGGNVRQPRPIAVDSGKAVSAQVGRGSSTYNN